MCCMSILWYSKMRTNSNINISLFTSLFKNVDIHTWYLFIVLTWNKMLRDKNRYMKRLTKTVCFSIHTQKGYYVCHTLKTVFTQSFNMQFISSSIKFTYVKKVKCKQFSLQRIFKAMCFYKHIHTYFTCLKQAKYDFLSRSRSWSAVPVLAPWWAGPRIVSN